MVILYSTGCPRCAILEKKMEGAGVAYEKCTSVEEMLAMGIQSVPVLSVDGKLLNFSAANAWLNGGAGDSAPSCGDSCSLDER